MPDDNYKPLAEKVKEMEARMAERGIDQRVQELSQQEAGNERLFSSVPLGDKMSNILTMGASGAAMGAPLGPLGIAGGAVAGAGAGMLMPPSQTPLTDIGAGAADMLSQFIMNRVAPGAGFAKRLLGQGVPTAVGAVLGNIGDHKGQVQDLDYGQLAFYAGITPTALALSSLTRPGPLVDAATQIKAMTGMREAMPLSVGEVAPSFTKMTEFFSSGSSSAKNLAKQQTEQALAAVEKLTGQNVAGVVDVAVTKARQETERSMRGIVKDFNTANKTWDPKAQKWILPTEDEFRKAMTLDRDHARVLRAVMHDPPEDFVKHFLPTGQESEAATFRFRALRQAFDTAGRVDELAPLSNAILMSMLQKNGAFRDTGTKYGVMLSGAGFQQALNKIGPQRLNIMFGPKATEALEKISTVMMETDPLNKMSGPSRTEGILSYMSNKAMFGLILSGVGGGTGATMAGGAMAAAGAAAGATVAVPLYTLVGKVLTNPDIAELLLKAHKNGDAAAASTLIRTLAGQKEKEKPEEVFSSPASRVIPLTR